MKIIIFWYKFELYLLWMMTFNMIKMISWNICCGWESTEHCLSDLFNKNGKYRVHCHLIVYCSLYNVFQHDCLITSYFFNYVLNYFIENLFRIHCNENWDMIHANIRYKLRNQPIVEMCWVRPVLKILCLIYSIALWIALSWIYLNSIVCRYCFCLLLVESVITYYIVFAI